MNMKCCKDCKNKKICTENQWVVTCDRLGYYKGEPCCDNFETEHYGIWNDMKKEFQFGIDEPTINRAVKKLFDKIGYDSYKWRFEVRKLPPELFKRTVKYNDVLNKEGTNNV